MSRMTRNGWCSCTKGSLLEIRKLDVHWQIAIDIHNRLDDRRMRQDQRDVNAHTLNTLVRIHFTLHSAAPPPTGVRHDAVVPYGGNPASSDATSLPPALPGTWRLRSSSARRPPPPFPAGRPRS